MTDRKVDPLADEIDITVAQLEIDRNVRVLMEECIDNRDDIGSTNILGSAQANWARNGFCTQPDATFQFFSLCEQSSGTSNKMPTFFCQTDRPRRAGKQGGTIISFKRRQTLGNCRWRQPISRPAAARPPFSTMRKNSARLSRIIIRDLRIIISVYHQFYVMYVRVRTVSERRRNMQLDHVTLRTRNIPATRDFFIGSSTWYRARALASYSASPVAGYTAKVIRLFTL